MTAEADSRFASRDPPGMGLTEASDYETTKFICERLDYENSLLVQRTSWIVASQAFLVSAFAFYITISGGLVAMNQLQQIVRAQHGDGWERLLVETRALPRFAGLAAPVVVPAVFLLTWIVVVASR